MAEGHWAADAIAWVWANGYMNGTGGTLISQGGTIRAQAAVLLMRFWELDR